MYQALLIAPDGDYMLAYSAGTIEEVEQRLADRGSEYYFYPFEAVITCKPNIEWRDQILRRRLVSVPGEASEFKGKTVNKYIEAIKDGVFDHLFA